MEGPSFVRVVIGICDHRFGVISIIEESAIVSDFVDFSSGYSVVVCIALLFFLTFCIS